MSFFRLWGLFDCGVQLDFLTHLGLQVRPVRGGCEYRGGRDYTEMTESHWNVHS